MGRHTDPELLPPDDPIFKKGLTIYTPPSARGSTPLAQPPMAQGSGGGSIEITQAQLRELRQLPDLDLVMLLSEINDCGWEAASRARLSREGAFQIDIGAREPFSCWGCHAPANLASAAGIDRLARPF